MSGIAPATRAAARRLRREMTPAERRVWQGLRQANRATSLHFRRQAPIGPYIADFAEFGCRLVVEIDGAGHGGARDASRTAWLEAQGFRVLRFRNAQVNEDAEAVIAAILDAAAAPHTHPLPTRGRGGSGCDTSLRHSGGPRAPEEGTRGHARSEGDRT